MIVVIKLIQLFTNDLVVTISNKETFLSRFSGNSEANASELQDNHEEMSLR